MQMCNRLSAPTFITPNSILMQQQLQNIAVAASAANALVTTTTLPQSAYPSKCITTSAPNLPSIISQQQQTNLFGFGGTNAEQLKQQFMLNSGKLKKN